MKESKPIRIDKFLWAVRIFKTRSLASEECKKGRVIINDLQVKPSRTVSRGEIIIVRKPPVIYTYRVLDPVENRVGAKLVMNFIEDLTSEDERAKLTLKQPGVIIYRAKGMGRPTKKERRDLERFTDDLKR